MRWLDERQLLESSINGPVTEGKMAPVPHDKVGRTNAQRRPQISSRIQQLATATPLALTVAALTAATFLRMALTPVFGSGYTFITFYPATMFSTVIAGWRYGLATAVASAALSVLLFIDPFSNAEHAVALSVFLAVDGLMIVIADVTGRARRGAEMSLALATARETGLQAEITARNQAEAALRESENGLRRFLDTASVGLVRVGRDFRYRMVNEAYAKIAGRRMEDIIGRSIPDVLGEAALAVIRPYAERVFQGERVSYEAELVLPELGQRWLSVHYTPERDATDAVIGWVGSILDITERKQAEKAQAHLVAIVESSEDAIIGKTLQGTITSWNQSAESLLGYQAEEAIGRSVTMLFPPDRVEEENGILDRLGKGESIVNYETVRRCKDGRIIPVSLTISPIRDHQGDILGASKIMRDITAHKQAEEAVRESEERLRLALDGAGLGSWDVDLSTGRAIWNRRHALMQGYEPDDQPYTMAQWQHRVHPDDRGSVLIAIDEARDSRAPFAVEHRVCLPGTSTVRWLSLYGRFSYDERGEPVRISGVSLDITERKLSEEALRQAELRFQNMAHSAPALIWQMDSTGVVFVNRHYLRFFDETLDGVKEMKWAEYLHPEDRAAYLAAYRTSFERQTSYEFQCRFRRYDGEYRWLKTAGVPHYGPEKIFLGFIGCSVDVTDIKRAEQALRESQERLEGLVDSAMDAVIAMDESQCIVLFNPAAERMFGCVADDILGSSINRFIPEVFRTAHRQHVNEFGRTGNTARRMGSLGSLRGLRENGEEFPIEASISSMMARGQRLFTVILRDITDRQLAEQALREAQERLQRWNVELEQAVQEKTAELQQSQDRLRAMASELNLAEQRERKRLATELHDHLQQMLVVGKITIGQGKRVASDVPACEAILEKVDDILSEALTYSRTLVAELSPPVLRDHGLAASLKWLAEYMKKKHGHTVIIVAPDDQDIKLPDDQVILLFQSVRELLINSAKHAGTGQAMLTLELRANQLYLTVHDEGKGFDLAAAAAAGTPTGGISSKFGLFSIQERMLALGGSFTMDSVPGRGTRATVILPLAKSTLDYETTVRASSLVAGRSHTNSGTQSLRPGNRSTVRVLLVDDHAMVRQGLRSVLDAYADVEIVGEAQEGVEAVKLVEELRPQVVVMDINMPTMNGIEATEHIKRDHPETVVIGISVNIGHDNVDAMQRAGAATLLTKEAAVEQLYDIIQNVVRDGRGTG